MTLDELKDEIFSLIAESVFDAFGESRLDTPFYFLWSSDNSTSYKPVTLKDIRGSLLSCQTKEDLDRLINVEWADALDVLHESMQELLNTNGLTLKKV
jgi:hypothetical protein